MTRRDDYDDPIRSRDRRGAIETMRDRDAFRDIRMWTTSGQVAAILGIASAGTASQWLQALERLGHVRSRVPAGGHGPLQYQVVVREPADDCTCDYLSPPCPSCAAQATDGPGWAVTQRFH